MVRAGAWLGLCWERLWPLAVPLFMVVCAYLAFSWAGGWQLIDTAFHTLITWVLRFLFLGALIASIWPLGKFEPPDREDVTRRIETKSGLEHRPLTAREDALEFGEGDNFAAALWREHQTRMGKGLSDLTSGTPSPDASRFDPFAIRAMLPIAAFAAFFVSFAPFGGTITDALGVNSKAANVQTRMDAWINPPAYTRKPPVYLSAESTAVEPSRVEVPTGSNFVLRFVGDTNIRLMQASAQNERDIKADTIDEALKEVEFNLVLEQESVIRLMHGNQQVAQWGISLTGDTAPKITFFEEPRAALSGSMELTYTVEDDYGVVSADAEILSLEPVKEGAVPLVDAPTLALPLPRQRAKTGISKLNRDLTQHPWAGSKVALTLIARDDMDQTGRSQTKEIVLPGRRFSKPLAQALIEQRRMLALDARQQSRVANLLDAVSSGPPEYIDNESAFLGMRVAYRRVVDAENHDDLRSALDLLWEIALAVEFGDLSEAERQLREAQERLSEALERGASDAEIDRLMQELRQAMNEMLQALAEQARNNPRQQNPFSQDQLQQLTENDLQSMMDRIEDLAKSGSQDAARQLLSEMQRMMDNLRAGQHEQQRQAEGNEMNQALDEMSEMMQEQQRLMDETYRMQRQQQQQRQGGPRDLQNQDQQDQAMRPQQGQNGQQSQQGEMSAQELADALSRLREQQEALRDRLGELGEQMEGMGLEPSEAFNNAQNEMGKAGENLGKGETGNAASNQAQALNEMRQEAQNMMQQMAGDRQQGGNQQAQQGAQGGVRDEQRSNDPLGRNANGRNENFGRSDVQVPSEIDAQRARRILDAIRKRLSIPDNPLIEKDYLERLLKGE